MTDQYIIGDTIKFYAEIKKYDGTLVDPSAISLEIRDSSDTLVTTLTPAKTATGKYEVEWTITGDAKTLYAKLIYTAGGKGHIYTTKFDVVTHITGAKE